MRRLGADADGADRYSIGAGQGSAKGSSESVVVQKSEPSPYLISSRANISAASMGGQSLRT